jgi:diadenosine tetraphosphate (Ap4A) HIT family hydrolase
MTIAPLRPGHVLVVPVEQIDKWTDLPLPLWTRLNEVAHTIAGALDATFEAVRVGLIVAGLEVPHCHIHLIPIRSESDLSFSNADPSVAAEELAAQAATIRAALAARGHSSEI